MCERTIVEGIIGHTAIIAENNNFTYINRLFPEFGEEPSITLVCKAILTPVRPEICAVTALKNDESEATNHDLTGSPLHHSFGDDGFDNTTIIGESKNWSKDEEYHVPLGNLRASAILNLCVERNDREWKLPLFALCDGSDKEKTVLLGAFVKKDWFSTMKVCIGGLVERSKIHNCSPLMQQHCELSKVPEREIKVSISSLYEFRGTSARIIDWSEKERHDFDGYLALQSSWSTLSFVPPPRATSNYLIAQVAAGWRDSLLNDLWEQLLLLDKYLTIQESYKKKNLRSRYSVLPLKFPHDFCTPYLKQCDNSMERLNLLLSGGNAFENSDDGTTLADERSTENDTDVDPTALLTNYLKELSTRQNLDFSDQLWQLVISSDDHAKMTDCIHAVLVEIVENNYKPQMNETDPTRLGKLVSELDSPNAVIPSLAGSFPLELVIDIGIEKMSRDYVYLLLSANLAESYELRQKLPTVSTGDFSSAKYRSKLMTMAQIHICLEFLLVLKNNLECPIDTSHSFFNYAFELYTSDESPVQSFADLIDNTIYTLRAPLSNAAREAISKPSPTSWRGTLSSSRRASQFKTTMYYSKIPIFPQNIYSPDDLSGREECFHATTAVSCSYKTN